MQWHKRPLARLATLLARPLSMFVHRLRGTTTVRPLSESFYSGTVSGLDGQPVDLARFDRQVTLVVNVASECGFAPQYAGLQALQDRYRSQGFSVLAFPSNDFGAQEPGSPDDIRAVCEREFRVRFPIFAVVETKPGSTQSRVYARLGESGHLPAWNFYKFLIGRDGQVAAVFPTTVEPNSRRLRAAVENALGRH